MNDPIVFVVGGVLMGVTGSALMDALVETRQQAERQKRSRNRPAKPT
jgi:hypothetical protein